MPRLPDRFDLWVRKARACPDPARQIDYVLGALAALREWHFLNIGTAEKPEIAACEADGARLLLLFSDAARVLEIVEQGREKFPGNAPPIISLPTVAAFTGCLENEAMKADGLLVNPGEDAVIVSMEQVKAFFEGWQKRGGHEASGFWIPNLTTEEEDFWQENGI